MLRVAIVVAVALAVSTAGQGPPQNPPAQTAPAAPAPPAPQRGRGGETFPAQQRPPGDPAVIARGKALYGVNCTFCHGPDLRGGQLNGPNLLRSQLVLGDQDGELIIPIVRGARAEKGMPPIADPGRGRQGDRRIHPQRVGEVAAAGHAAAGRRARRAVEHPGRRRRGGPHLFRREMRRVPFAGRRSAGPRHAGCRCRRRCRTSGFPAAASAAGGRARRTRRRRAATRRTPAP